MVNNNTNSSLYYITATCESIRGLLTLAQMMKLLRWIAETNTLPPEQDFGSLLAYPNNDDGFRYYDVAAIFVGHDGWKYSERDRRLLDELIIKLTNLNSEMVSEYSVRENIMAFVRKYKDRNWNLKGASREASKLIAEVRNAKKQNVKSGGPKGIRIPVCALKGRRPSPLDDGSYVTIPSKAPDLLNKLSVSQLAELSNFSKAYISQVKNGQRPPSEKLLLAVTEYYYGTNEGKREMDVRRAIIRFVKSRREGVSQGTIEFYVKYLTKSIPTLGLTPSPRRIERYLESLSCSIGGKHAYFRAISVFFNWLYSRKSGFNLKSRNNPVSDISPPKKPKLILPSLDKSEVELLITSTNQVRDKAIIALLAESGLRLSELTSITLKQINWKSRTIKVIGKGNKEGYAPFGDLTERYISQWIDEYHPKPNKPIWNIGFWGIKGMLHNLGLKTGLKCNPHTFRRTFACLLRKAGVDTMTIKDLGRWESLEMVQRYTRSITFEDSLKHYKAPLS